MHKTNYYNMHRPFKLMLGSDSTIFFNFYDGHIRLDDHSAMKSCHFLVRRVATLQIWPLPIIVHVLAWFWGAGSRNHQSRLQKERQGTSCRSQTRWENTRWSHCKAWCSYNHVYILHANHLMTGVKFVWIFHKAGHKHVVFAYYYVIMARHYEHLSLCNLHYIAAYLFYGEHKLFRQLFAGALLTDLLTRPLHITPPVIKSSSFYIIYLYVVLHC